MAGRGAFWQVLGGGWQTIVRLGASAILARALDPQDFGIFAMALMVGELIYKIGALGMSTGVIAKRDVTDDDLCTCFWSLAALRFTLFVIAFSLAPLAAFFFKTPKVTWVLRAVSFTFLFSILSAVSSTILQKELKFGSLVLINVLSVVIESGIAIMLVLTTNLRYWALVYGMLASSLFMHMAIFFRVGWFPRFHFSKDSFRYLFHYGINTLGFSIVDYFHQNIDYLVVGKLLGSTSLGLYRFAYNIPHLIIDRLAQPVGSVVFPTLSNVQDDDKRLIGGYVKAAHYIALGAFPALGGLAVLAPQIVTVLWGAKWLPIVTPLRILCLASAIKCVVQPLSSIFYCRGRPDIPFKFSLIRLSFTFTVVALLGYFYGLTGIAIGILVSVLPSFYILHVAFKMLRESPLKLGKKLLVPSAATGISMLCAYLVSSGLTVVQLGITSSLVLSILSGAIGYCAPFLMLFHKTRREVFSTLVNIISPYYTTPR